MSPLTQRVPFYDLSLATKEGRNTLIHRVGYAVNQVCPDYDEEASPYDVSGCKDFAWTGAWRQMRPLFKQARMGQAPLIATIEIVAAK